MKQYYYLSSDSFRIADEDIPVYNDYVAVESEAELHRIIDERKVIAYYPVNFFAIMQTKCDLRDYRKVYIREWEDDIESLREHIENMSDGTEDVSTYMIRPATEEEIKWFNSDDYIE